MPIPLILVAPKNPLSSTDQREVGERRGFVAVDLHKKVIVDDQPELPVVDTPADGLTARVVRVPRKRLMHLTEEFFNGLHGREFPLRK